MNGKDYQDESKRLSQTAFMQIGEKYMLIYVDSLGDTIEEN